MNIETKAALENLRDQMLEEAETQDRHGMGEVLSGNVVKEQGYRSTAAGLRMAVSMVTERMSHE